VFSGVQFLTDLMVTTGRVREVGGGKASAMGFSCFCRFVFGILQ
jgi:hypothetical protein